MSDDRLIPSESAEQQHLFQWARMMSGAHPELALMYKITNEGKRSRINGARMVAEGMKKGVPDICLPVPRGDKHGLYIEMKRRKGGSVSADQLKWLDNLMRQGYECHVCRGCEEARSVILDYLKRD